jgi:hypothetical protein
LMGEGAKPSNIPQEAVNRTLSMRKLDSAGDHG